MNGYSELFRIGGNSQRDGIMVNVSEDIPSNFLGVVMFPLEGFYVEINLRTKKWLLGYSHTEIKTTFNFTWKP